MTLPDDCVRVILAFVAHGPWHAPTRLVCRAWAAALSPPLASQNPAEPYGVAALRRDAPLHVWLREQGWLRDCDPIP